jgi:hypothetical protein
MNEREQVEMNRVAKRDCNSVPWFPAVESTIVIVVA